MSSSATEVTIPSLEELYRITAEADRRVLIKDVEWAFYERLVDSIPEGANLQVDYDGKDVEIRSPSWTHDDVSGLDEIRRWVVEEDSRDESAWARGLRAWLRAEVVPRLSRRGD
jgi:hypothetical protein